MSEGDTVTLNGLEVNWSETARLLFRLCLVSVRAKFLQSQELPFQKSNCHLSLRLIMYQSRKPCRQSMEETSTLQGR